MVELTNFNPTSVGELLDAFVEEGSAALERPLDDLAASVPHFQTLAEATLLTLTALAEGRISEQTAKEILSDRKKTIKQVLEFEVLMGLAVAQRLTDAFFRVIGAAIRNRTGLDIIPSS